MRCQSTSSLLVGFNLYVFFFYIQQHIQTFTGTLYPDWKGQKRKVIRRKESEKSSRRDSEKSSRRDSESDVMKAQRDELSKRAESLGNRITKSKFFTKTCQDIFKKIDVDNSGELEKIEVYTGVLVLYTMIIAYVVFERTFLVFLRECHYPILKSRLLLTCNTRKSLEHQRLNAHSNVTKNLTRASRSNTGT